MVFHPGLEVNAIGPDIDVAPREIARLPAVVVAGDAVTIVSLE
jgi:hypothetical protein